MIWRCLLTKVTRHLSGSSMKEKISLGKATSCRCTPRGSLSQHQVGLLLLLQLQPRCLSTNVPAMLLLVGIAATSTDKATASSKPPRQSAFAAVQAAAQAQAESDAGHLLSLLAERDAELATMEAELAVARAALAGNTGDPKPYPRCSFGKITVGYVEQLVACRALQLDI